MNKCNPVKTYMTTTDCTYFRYC